MASLKSSKWLRLFETFAADLRIKSKEVNSSDPRGVPLDMWVSQKRFLQEIGSGLDNGIHVFNCLKSRQLGCTTLSLALVDVFWPAMHPNLIGCLVTDNEKNREINRGMIEGYIDSFPAGYFGEAFKIVKANRTMLQFSNGSRLDFLVAGTKKKSISWAEGQGYAYAHLTEISKYGDPQGLKSLEESFAQTNPHRLYVYESTANGMNHWHEKWTAGVKDITQRSFFIGWWSGDNNRLERKSALFAQYGSYPATAEERAKIEQVRILYEWKVTQEQLAWYRWKQVQASSEQDLLEQNNPWTADEAFVEPGYSFFNARLIGKDLKRLHEEIPLYKGYRYEVGATFYDFRCIALDPDLDDVSTVELKMWEEPVEGARYAIGFDPAYGRNEHKDGHAIVVLRCFADRVIQVAEYRTSEPETRYAAWVAFHICAIYRDCMINVEILGPGELVMTEFRHLREYLSAEMNVHRTTERDWTDAFGHARWFLYHREDSFGAGFAANYQSNQNSRERMLYSMRGVYSAGEVVLQSEYLLREMLNVLVVDGHIGAPESSDESKKDDRVFALGLALLSWTKWIRSEMIASGQTYEVVMREQDGSTSIAERSINSLVRRFMSLADEEPEPEKTWRDEYHL
jgi:Terminase RNaseH-like domain